MGVEAGATETFTFDITRKDLSNWDTVAQDWYVFSV
jgi:beta-glucosidase